MAFFTRLNSSVSLLTPAYDDEDDTITLSDKTSGDPEAKSSGDGHSVINVGDSVGKNDVSASTTQQICEPVEEKQQSRLTSAQLAEMRLSQLRSHEARNLTLAELQRLQHLTSDSHSRRLTLAQLQKLQQQAPIVDSRHAELLRPRLVVTGASSSLFAHSLSITRNGNHELAPQPPAVTAQNATAASSSSAGPTGREGSAAPRKMNFDFDLELGVEV